MIGHITFSVVVLLIVFLLIAVRQVGNIRLQIWQIMAGGAVAVLLSGQIAPLQALHAINVDVLLFLFGMFVVGEALEKSGYLFHLSYRLFNRARTVDALVLLILMCVGASSALLMNDTLAVIGTPLMLLLGRRHDVNVKVLLFALAFGVTIGSVMSPIGNPQNLLIALGGNVPDPFTTFFGYLFIPTLINLFAAYLVLRFFFRREFHPRQLNHTREVIKDRRLAALSRLALILIVILVAMKTAAVYFRWPVDFRLTYIALIAACPVLLFSEKRLEIIKTVDWHTLIFFAAMFVLMASVWDSGFFQSLVTRSGLPISAVPVVLGAGVLLSQLISNVPMVALYMPLLMHDGVSIKALVALAAGSTIAGNLLILGAASNVIILHNAEKKAGVTLTFTEFLKVGLPLTLINVAVYGLFLTLV